MNKDKSEQARADGNAAFKKGRWSEAIGFYTTAVVHDPQQILAYTNRAAAYLKVDKYDDALRDTTIALELDPKNIKALYRQALALKGLDRFDDALKVLREVLFFEPDNDTAKDEMALLESRPTFAALRQNRSARKTFVPKASPINLPTDPTPAQLLLHLNGSPSKTWQVLQLLPPPIFLQRIHSLVEPDTLGAIFLGCRYGATFDAARVRQIMEGIKSTERYGMNTAMLSSTEREAGEEARQATG